MPLRLIVQAMFMQQLRRWTYQVDIPGGHTRWMAKYGPKNNLHPITKVHVAIE
jgi:hypothetical protein